MSTSLLQEAPYYQGSYQFTSGVPVEETDVTYYLTNNSGVFTLYQWDGSSMSVLPTGNNYAFSDPSYGQLNIYNGALSSVELYIYTFLPVNLLTGISGIDGATVITAHGNISQFGPSGWTHIPAPAQTFSFTDSFGNAGNVDVSVAPGTVAFTTGSITLNLDTDSTNPPSGVNGVIYALSDGNFQYIDFENYQNFRNNMTQYMTSAVLDTPIPIRPTGTFTMYLTPTTGNFTITNIGSLQGTYVYNYNRGVYTLPGGNMTNELILNDAVYLWTGSSWLSTTLIASDPQLYRNGLRFKDSLSGITYTFNSANGSVGKKIAQVLDICGRSVDYTSYDIPEGQYEYDVVLTTDNVVQYWASGVWNQVPMAQYATFRDKAPSSGPAGIRYLAPTYNQVMKPSDRISRALVYKYCYAGFDDTAPPANLFMENLVTYQTAISETDPSTTLVLSPQPPSGVVFVTASTATITSENPWTVLISGIAPSTAVTVMFEYWQAGTKQTICYFIQRGSSVLVTSTNNQPYIYTDTQLINWVDGTLVDSSWNATSGIFTAPTAGIYHFVLNFNYTYPPQVTDQNYVPYISVTDKTSAQQLATSIISIVNFNQDGVEILGPLQKGNSILDAIISLAASQEVYIGYVSNNFPRSFQTSNGSAVTTLSIARL